MIAPNAKAPFLQKLTEFRRGTERSIKVLAEISKMALSPKTKETLAERVFVFERIGAILDECFRLLREEPATSTRGGSDTFVKSVGHKVAQITNSSDRDNFTLTYANYLVQFRLDEYLGLIAASSLAGNYVIWVVTSKALAVGVLLESCFAERLASMEGSFSSASRKTLNCYHFEINADHNSRKATGTLRREPWSCSVSR